MAFEGILYYFLAGFDDSMKHSNGKISTECIYHFCKHSFKNKDQRFQWQLPTP